MAGSLAGHDESEKQKRRRRNPAPFSLSARSVIVPWYPLRQVDVLILDRILQHHAGAHLADMSALDFLPGRLRGGVFETARGFQILAALGQFCLADQDIGRALVVV